MRTTSSKGDGDGPGDHWVTLDGNHVLIHESEGAQNPPSPPSAGIVRARQTRPTPQDLTRKIPRDIRSAMARAIEDSNRPSGDPNNPQSTDDKKGGFHEESGIAGTDSNGQWVIYRDKPGSYGDPTKIEHLPASTEPADQPVDKVITEPQVFFHVHPEGETVGVGPDGNLHTFNWKQPPSDDDKAIVRDIYEKASVDNPSPEGINIVFAAREKEVYFFDKSRQIGNPMTLRDFLRLPDATK